MYIRLLENGSTDLADYFFVVFVIVGTRFAYKKFFGKSTRNRKFVYYKIEILLFYI